MQRIDRIRWHRPTRAGIERATTRHAERRSAFAAEAAAPPAGLDAPPPAHLALLLHVGVPVPEPGDTPRDFAVRLLKIAAEFEHALMAQYLYAAASLDPDGGPSPENYVVKVMRVAIQEMGHLATVQNLLLLAGGPDALHLQRDLLRKASELNPIPFVLEPVGLPALAKFVAAEMPAQIPAVKVEKVAELLKIAKDDSGTEPHRVGAIYAALRWLFLPGPEADAWLDLVALADYPPDFHLEDSDLSPADVMDAFEARPDEWDADLPDFILDTPRTCAEAAAAIARVADQGEGWNQAGDTHFAEFLELVDAFEAGHLAPLIRPVAKSPTLRPGTGGEGGGVISHPYAAAWGEVFTLQYELLALSIVHALATSRVAGGAPELREGLADLALRGMRRVIGPVSEILTGLPIATGGAALAGPPYDLDPAALELGPPDVLKDRHLERLDRLSRAYARVEADAEFPTHPDHGIALANLRNFDKRRRNLFET